MVSARDSIFFCTYSALPLCRVKQFSAWPGLRPAFISGREQPSPDMSFIVRKDDV